MSAKPIFFKFQIKIDVSSNPIRPFETCVLKTLHFLLRTISFGSDDLKLIWPCFLARLSKVMRVWRNFTVTGACKLYVGPLCVPSVYMCANKCLKKIALHWWSEPIRKMLVVLSEVDTHLLICLWLQESLLFLRPSWDKLSELIIRVLCHPDSPLLLPAGLKPNNARSKQVLLLYSAIPLWHSLPCIPGRLDLESRPSIVTAQWPVKLYLWL